jgi:hypothetical protein
VGIVSSTAGRRLVPFPSMVWNDQKGAKRDHESLPKLNALFSAKLPLLTHFNFSFNSHIYQNTKIGDIKQRRKPSQSQNWATKEPAISVAIAADTRTPRSSSSACLNWFQRIRHTLSPFRHSPFPLLLKPSFAFQGVVMVPRPLRAKGKAEALSRG